MTEEKESLGRFLASKEFIVSLIIALFFCWVQSYAFALPVTQAYNIQGVYAIFVGVLLVGAAAKYLRMSRQGQAILWAMLSSTLALGWTAYHTFFGTAWVTTWSWTGDWFIPYTEGILEWMGPMHLANPEYAEQMLTGGVSVPWNAWATPFAFYYCLGLMIFLLQISIATILRRQFVDVEKLTFPYAVGAVQVAEALRPDTEDRGSKRILLIGIVLGILLEIGAVQGAIWEGAGWSWWDYWGTTNYTIPGLPNSAIKLMVIPYLVALNFLSPVSVLLSVVVIGFVWWDILPAIWVGLDLAPLLSTDPGWNPDWQYYESLGWPAMAAPFMYGGIMALGLTYVFFTRKSWTLSFKAFLSRISGGEEPELAKGENYAFAWAGLLVSAIVLMGIYTVVGWAAYVTPLVIFELILFFIAAVRMRGEFTTWPGIWWENHGSSNGLFIPLIPTFPGGWGSGANIRGMWFNGHVHGGLIQDAANGPTIGAVMESYKMGSVYEVPKRYILVGVSIGLVLAYLVGLLTTAQVVYSVGINNMGFNWDGMGLDQLNIWFTTGTSDPTYGPSTYNFLPDFVPIERAFANFFAGAILVVLLTVLRSVFAWVPLHPLGLIIGVSQNMYWNYFMVLVAFVLKLAVVRIGGARTYQRVGVPLAIGVVFGSFFTDLISAWAQAL